MKTDKILHLIQQKKIMRSGGALPLPKAQYGFMTPPGIKLQQSQQPVSKVAANINKPLDTPLDTPVDQFINIYDTAYEDYDNKFQKLNTFPKLSGKTVDLTAGRYRGAKVPIEYLDMIVESAKRSGVDPLQSLAQAARESTFLQDVNLLNRSKAKNRNPMALVSAWNVDEKYQPYSWIRFLADKKVPGIKSQKDNHGWMYTIEDEDETNQYLQSHPELKEQYIQKIKSAPALTQTNFFDLYHDFVKQKGLKGYNPGDPDYVNKVNKDIELLQSDPEFMKYYKQAVKQNGGLAKAQNGLQYVPSGDYGRYYDPETKEYVPQVYLPDVEISASKDLPFQNNKFAPFLTARGTADYVPLETVFLPGTPVVKGLGKVGNALLDAVNPLAGMRNLKSSIPDYTPGPAYVEALERLNQTRAKYLDELNKLQESPQVGKSLGDITTDIDALNASIKPRSEATTGDLQNMLDQLRSINANLEQHVPLHRRAFTSSDISEQLARQAQDPGDMPGTGVSDVGEAISMQDRIKNFEDIQRQEGIGLSAKYLGRTPQGARFEFVPEKYMIEAKGLTGKGTTVKPEDFYTTSELQKKIDQLAAYNRAQAQFDEMNPLTGADMVMSALSGDKSRDELFQTLFPNVSIPNFNEKIIPSQYMSELREALQYLPSQYFQDPLNPKRTLKWDLQNRMREDSMPKSLADYLSQKSKTWHKEDPLGYAREMMGVNKTEGLSMDEIRRLAESKQNELTDWYHQRLLQDFGKPFTAGDAVRLGLNPNKMGGLTKSKAREILHDKSVHGHPLTDKQRRFFGWVAGGRKQTGGNASVNNITTKDLWEKTTGSDWSQAKKLGLTDGSYEKNIALRERLLEGLRRGSSKSEKPSLQPGPTRSKFKVENPIISAARDASSVAPSRQKSAYDFYSQQPFGVSAINPNSPIPTEVQLAMINAQQRDPDMIYQTPTGVKKAAQDVYRTLAQPTENDLVNAITGALSYPLQAGVNISNVLTGDVPISNDEQLGSLAFDALSLIPAGRALRGLPGTTGRTINQLKNFELTVKPKMYERYSAGIPGFEGFEIVRRGKRFNPKTIQVNDKTNPGSYVTASRNPDGSYSFHMDMSQAMHRAPRATALLESLIKQGSKLKEASTMSLDSYKLLTGRVRNVGKEATKKIPPLKMLQGMFSAGKPSIGNASYSVAPAGRTILNAQASRNKFLDDIADQYYQSWEDIGLSPQKVRALDAWDQMGAPMQFSSKKLAEEAAKRINERYLNNLDIGQEMAFPVKGASGKWNISLPNFELTRVKKLGGTSKIVVRKSK